MLLGYVQWFNVKKSNVSSLNCSDLLFRCVLPTVSKEPCPCKLWQEVVHPDAKFHKLYCACSRVQQKYIVVRVEEANNATRAAFQQKYGNGNSTGQQSSPPIGVGGGGGLRLQSVGESEQSSGYGGRPPMSAGRGGQRVGGYGAGEAQRRVNPNTYFG